VARKFDPKHGKIDCRSTCQLDEVTSQKHHSRPNQINHHGHVGCVQNDMSQMNG
jgi:hypothetical protein